MRSTLTISILALALGCSGPPAPTDAGEDAGTPQSDAGTDAELPDTTAPEVTITIPRDGDVEIDPATTIRIAFSEPIDPASGIVTAEIDGAGVALGAPNASADAQEITVTPSSPLPSNASVTVTVDAFEDLNGNTMAAPYMLTFSTSDPFAPFVTGATPGEGASVDPQTSTITVDFSEAMNAALGAARLEGGPGTIGAATWNGAQATFAVSGLAQDTAYRIELIGFADPAGNALDGTPYLGDGALDFTTGPDAIAPVVTEASPSEGAAAIPPTRTTRLRIVFSEPMDTTSGTATLGTTELQRSWAGGGTILALDVTGLLEADSTYRVVLDGFRDVAGNALDGSVYLGDGALDFATGEDELPPFVLYSSPTEGATAIRWTTNSIFLTFSEAMDTTLTDIPVSDGVSSATWTGTWSSGGALLTIDVTGLLISGRSYVLDFTAFHDADGLSLDAAHSYLGDGRLAFTTDVARGENCQDFLTNADATMTAEGHLTWSIANTAVTNVDGAAPCDTSGGSADAVVRYTKTTPDSTGSGGSVLRITVSTTVTLSPELNVDVLRDVCAPTSATARLACVTNDEPQVLELDVGAGEYFVWVASSTGNFDGVTVEIEEVPAGLGDTCQNAIPITAGTTMITPTGAQNLQGPSCAASALTWYRYTTTQGLGIVRTGAARTLGARERASGQPLLCRTAGVALPVMAAPGTEVCVAVESGAATTISIEELPYDGVRGIASNTGITAPATGFSTPTLTCLIATPTRLYTAGSDLMAVAPVTGGELTQFDPDPSLPGDQGVAIGEAVYTISDATFNMTTPNSLVFQLVDSTGTPLAVPLAIDTTPAYMSTQKLGTMTVDIDGTNFILVQDTPTTPAPTYFYSLPIAGGAPVLLGRNDTLQDVAAIAVDATYVYVTANISDTVTEGIYRIRRDELSNPAATPVLLYGGGLNYSDANGAMYLGSLGGRTWMYFRTYGPADVHLLLDPDTATPTYLGTLWTTPNGNRTGMAYDPAIPALYVLDHEPNPDQWVRIE